MVFKGDVRLNENTETNVILDSTEIVVDGEEVLVLDDTQIIDTESEGSVDTSAEALVDADPQLEVLGRIYDDVHLILVFVILTFCSACFRSWRVHSLKGGK